VRKGCAAHPAIPMTARVFVAAVAADQSCFLARNIVTHAQTSRNPCEHQSASSDGKLAGRRHSCAGAVCDNSACLFAGACTPYNWLRMRPPRRLESAAKGRVGRQSDGESHFLAFDSARSHLIDGAGAIVSKPQRFSLMIQLAETTCSHSDEDERGWA